jgi:hypothetical protein
VLFSLFNILGSVPLGLGPIEMPCISGLIFFGTSFGFGDGESDQVFLFLFLIFSQFWEVPNLAIINKEDLVEHFNNHFTFCLLT